MNNNVISQKNEDRSPSLIQEQIANAIVYGVMFNVPWQDYKELLTPPNPEIKNLVELTLLKLSASNVKIDFDSDIWDITFFNRNKTIGSGRFNFNLIPDCVRKITKAFVLYDIVTTRNISTCKANYSSLSTTLTSYFLRTHGNNPLAFYVSELINCIKDRHHQHSTNVSKGVIIQRFLLFLDAANIAHFSNTDYDEIESFLREERTLGIKKRKLRKYPSVPEELIIKIERAALTVMRDPLSPYNMRISACCLLVQIWLGLRPEELTLLRKEDYREGQSHGLTLPYITYRSPKNHLKSFPIYCFELSSEAIKTAITINSIYNNDLSELFTCLKGSDFHAFTSKTLARLLDKFYIKYLNDVVTHPWEGISAHKTNSTAIPIIYTPSLYQYRVHLCTYLYDKGISREWIEQNMSHMSDLSSGYYYRREDELQKKDRENVTLFVEQVINNNIFPIGNNGPQLYEDIATTAIQVEGDINALVKSLGKKYRLRTLAFGICAKAAVSKCQGESEYEKLLCAYGDCSNIVYTLNDLPDAMQRFENLKQTYSADQENGRINAAAKELNIMKRFIKNRLEPELKQLIKEIKANGEETTMRKYPAIKQLHLDINTFSKEINLWKAKTN